jgi:uncharacterized protein YoxC
VSVGEIFFIIALNCIIIFILYTYQQKSLEKRIKHLKIEIQDLEDLVEAIIEEFEEVAEITESRVKEAQNNEIVETVGGIEPGLQASSNSNAITEVYQQFEAEVNEDPIAEFAKIPNSTPIDPILVDNLVIERQSENNGGGSATNNNNTITVRPVNDPKHRQIVELWEQGLSIEEIARQLETGRGEIQLILEIYRRS